MSTPELSKSSTQYTAFWPLIIILSTVLIISGFELINLLGQRQQLRLVSAQLEKPAQQAQLINGTLGKMSKELLLLSSNSEEARKIVRDFGIQMRPPEVPAAKK